MKTRRNIGEHRGERHGVVAVCVARERFLVIRRSDHVEAPGAYCFPGGGLEPGENEQEALLRELREELGCQATAHHRLWRSRTEWNVHLAWWLVSIEPAQALQPNQREVAEVLWMSEAEMRASPRLLSSNIEFLDAWRGGQFELGDWF